MALDATVGGVSANSYVTRAEAVAYMENRLYTADWDALTVDEQDKTLIMATRLIDLLCWTGRAVSSDQALEWPKVGMRDHADNIIPSDVIPNHLKYAVIEYAGIIAGSPPNVPNDAFEQGIKFIKAGPMEVQFRDGITFNSLPYTVRLWLRKSWLCPDPDNVAEFVVV